MKKSFSYLSGNVNVKKILLLLGIMVMLVSALLCISGCGKDKEPAVHGVTETGFEYKIQDGEVTITKYTLSQTDIVIPSEIEGTPVTKIGAYAFQSCDNLTNVVISEGIHTIGRAAFTYCENLRTVKIPNSMRKIDNTAFEFSAGYTNKLTITAPHKASYYKYPTDECIIWVVE